MADEPVEQPPETEEETAPKKDRGSLFTLIKAVAFVSVIVVVEIVAAAMLAPSAQETERLARELVAAADGQTAQVGHEHHRKSDGHSEDVREVTLGVYNITRYNPKTGTTMAIDFELYATVLADEVAEFEHLFEQNQARVREQVIMTLHAAESTDLTDAGLGLIKRRILEKTNRALGQPLVDEVLFSKFNFVER
jgi:flagellar basal body-associated protein FliL